MSNVRCINPKGYKQYPSGTPGGKNKIALVCWWGTFTPYSKDKKMKPVKKRCRQVLFVNNAEDIRAYVKRHARGGKRLDYRWKYLFTFDDRKPRVIFASYSYTVPDGKAWDMYSYPATSLPYWELEKIAKNMKAQHIKKYGPMIKRESK